MKFSVGAVALIVLLSGTTDAFLSGTTDAFISHTPTSSSTAPTTISGSKTALASYLDSLEDACDGDRPVEDCAPALASYLDAVSTGAEKPSAQAGAGIASYLNTVAPSAGPAATAVAAPADPAAVTGYLDAVSAGAAAVPPVDSVRSYLDAVSMGSILPREAFPTNMAHEFARAKTNGNTIGYESRKPYTYSGYKQRTQSSSPAALLSAVSEVCDADDKSPECANAIAAYEDAREAWPTSMGKELSRGRTNDTTVGYESRKPYSFNGYKPKLSGSSPASLLAAASEVCDADDKSPDCANAIAAYEDAREAWPTSMGKELSRSRTNGKTVGYESRKPYSFTGYKPKVQGSSPAALLSAVSEVCDADDKSPDCASAIAAYEDARASYPTSMSNDLSRGRTNGNTIGYESRKPYSFSGYKNVQSSSPAALLSTVSEVCDADDKSPECANAIAAYEDAREAWPTSMGKEFSRGRTNGNTIGYESRKPYSFNGYTPKVQGSSPAALLAAANEVCDADAKSPDCANAIAAYEDARASYPTSMSNDLSRGRTNGNTIGYESRKPYSFNGYKNVQSSSPAALLSTVSEVCDADDKSPECANAIAAYEDAREAWPTSMGKEFSRGRTNGNTVGYESRKPYSFSGYKPKVQGSSPAALLAEASEVCDADDKSLDCANAIAAYEDARASYPTSMSNDLSRGRTNGNTIGYESRKPYSFNGYKNVQVSSPAALLSTVSEVCDADDKSPECANAIAAYEDAREAWPTSMGQELSRARSTGGTIGYESRKPYTYSQGNGATALLASLDELCDADVNSPECKSAIAAYEDAREAWPTSMGKEFSRAQSSLGTVGYESRKPYTYGSYQSMTQGSSPAALLAAATEVCDADDKSAECSNAIAAYEDARASYPASMDNDLSRARSTGGTIGYVSRQPYTYGSYQPKTQGSTPAALLSAANEVCDADSKSPECANAIAAYEDARESWPTSMGQEFSRGRTTSKSSSVTTVGYESRKPHSYANAINDFCDGNNPVNECAPAISSYLDAVSSGAAEPAPEVGAGIASYLSSISGAGESSAAAAGAAISGYLDSIAAGAVSAPPAPAIKSYLEDIRAGEVSTPTTSSSIAGYLDALGGGAAVSSGGSGPPAYLNVINEACDGDKPVDDCAPAIASYLDAIATGAAQPSREAGAVIASSLDNIAPNRGASACTEPAAVSGYLDAVSSGSMIPPATSALTPYLQAIKSGAVLPREAFPTNMAHEFSRAKTNAGNVGYESRRPYTYGRYY